MTSDGPGDSRAAAPFPRGLLDVPGAAFLHAAFGTSLLSAEGVILDLNEEFRRMLGYERDELLGRNLLEIVHPDDHGVINRIHGAIRRGEIDSDQTRRLYVRKDGTVLYAMAGVTAIRDGDGRLQGMIKQIQDISRRVRAERELQESLARQRVVFDSLAEGVVVYDGDGRARMSNPAALEILGISADELHQGGRWPAVKLVDDEGNERRDKERPFREALRSGQPQKGIILRAEREDGGACWIRANAQPLVRPGGEEPFVVVSFADVTALKERERELVHHALHDPLTDLPNRRYFLTHLERVVLPAERGETGNAVLYVDLDGFKRVNDRYGHAVGDSVLVEVSHRMVETVGARDVVARLAGDEFGVLLSGVAGVERVVRVGNELIGALGAPFSVGGVSVQIGASVGLTFVEEDDRDPKEVLNRADASLRRAKEQGRARLVEFSPEVDREARRIVQLERDLAYASERGELSLVYAPIVPLAGSAPVAERAMLRWHHPHFGDIAPEQVQRLMRETGLATELHKWILREAVARLSHLPPSGAHARTAVPVTQELILDDGIERFRDLLDESGLDPARLVVAVYGAEDAEVDVLAGKAQELAGLGLRLMVTATGEGRTRSRRAAEFPYHWIGVHPEAITRSLADGPSRAMVRGVLDSLRAVGVKTLAETTFDGPVSVEDLGSMGFDYLFGEPADLPVPERAQRLPA